MSAHLLYKEHISSLFLPNRGAPRLNTARRIVAVSWKDNRLVRQCVQVQNFRSRNIATAIFMSQ